MNVTVAATSAKLYQLHQSLSWFQLTTFRLCLIPHRVNMPHWLEDCPTIWQRFEISAYISKLRKVRDCVTWSPIQPKFCPWAISDVQFEAYQEEVQYLHRIFPKRGPFVVWFNQGSVFILDDSLFNNFRPSLHWHHQLLGSTTKNTALRGC